MAKVIFTPWKENSQLLTVRNQFYPPPRHDGPDMRSKACATVGAWKLRGNLPHPVEATALLTDAILHDDAQKNSVFSIRATYSAAFCRFVTGLVDSKIHGLRKTMFQRAVDLGLPASFVELRHEATHRELPSLTVLRSSTQRSLEWLWGYYWVKTEPEAVFASLGQTSINVLDDGSEDEEIEAIKALVRPVLEKASKEGEVTEPPRKRRKVQQQHLSTVSTQLVAVCRSSRMAPVAVSRVMLEEGGLVPVGRRLGDSLASAISRWDTVLQMVAEGYPSFLVTLTEEAANVLAFTRSPDAKSDSYCEGVYLWLDHILSSSHWESRRQFLSYSYLRTVCEGASNHWTTLLKKSIGKEENKPQGKGKRKPLGKPTRQAELLRVELDEDLKGLGKNGWETVDTWDSRPLGVA